MTTRLTMKPMFRLRAKEPYEKPTVLTRAWQRIRFRLLDRIDEVPVSTLPIEVRRPVVTEDGLVYGLLDISPLGGSPALFDVYNGPETNPTCIPVATLGPVRLLGILIDLRKAWRSRPVKPQSKSH